MNTKTPLPVRAAGIALLGLGAGVLLALPADAQVRTTSTQYTFATVPTDDDSSKAPAKPSETIQKLVRDQLATKVPVYDKRLLTTYQTPSAWQDNLNHRYLNTLLGETPFAWEGQAEPPAEADRLVDASKSMRIKRAEGEFRYHSRKRTFSAELKGKPVPTADRVIPQIGDVLGKLAFPLAEGGKPNVQVQEVALSGADGNVAEKFPSYAFYTLRRQVAGLPVEGSAVRAAVNARGEIQRLKIAWPHFRLKAGAELLPRERVIEEAAQKVFAQTPTERLQLAARLVYAKDPKGKEGDFVPALQVDVTDGETPYRLTIPVAK